MLHKYILTYFHLTAINLELGKCSKNIHTTLISEFGDLIIFVCPFERCYGIQHIISRCAYFISDN